MSVSASVVAAWQDGTFAYLAVSVPGDRVDSPISGNGTNTQVPVEYIGQTPLLNADGSAKPLSQLKAELVAACSAARNASRSSVTTLNVTGSVSL